MKLDMERYNLLLDMIQEVQSYIDHQRFYQFLTENIEKSWEFRISGTFGDGFKIHKRSGRFGVYFLFSQYPEDITKESQAWIEKNNKTMEQEFEELAILNLTDEWHNGDSKLELHEYLGMTEEEYDEKVMKQN